MNIKDVRGYLNNLSQLLANAGGKQLASEIQVFCDALEPFEEKSIKQFADLLEKMDNFERTGAFEESKKKIEPKPIDDEKIRSALSRLNMLISDIKSDEMALNIIDAEISDLNKELSKEEGLELAKEFGLLEKFTSKKMALDAIGGRIKERKIIFDRTQSIDNSTE